jgi:hypothetical protein
VSEHVPLKWQDRVKVPQIVKTRTIPKKKSPTFYDGLENDLLQLPSVPHFDETSPYKERWEFPVDTRDETLQNPQEGPTVPIASSCIPGALVIDPMIRETVEESGMKVTDHAMWLLTVALKEHIKNLLSDSIEYKKGLQKGQVFPPAIRYPNVLASSSNKNRKISKGRNSAASAEPGRKKRLNSIDLFAALNKLPSGQPSSIGGSISRLSLEQTFLSGFNSIPSFDTGNTFKDVQSFISNSIMVMAKDRKPEEKKKSSHSSRQKRIKPTPGLEDSTKTPSPRHPSNGKASVPIAIAPPMPSLESPPLTNNMSPAVVQTPVLDSSSPKTDVSQLVLEKKKDVATSNVSSAADAQAGESEASRVEEANPVKVEKPIQKAATGAPPSQSGPQRSGAGRGAKNLAALMARAAESSSNLKEATQGGEKNSNTSTQNAQWPSSTPVNTEQNKPNIHNPNSQGSAVQAPQSNADSTKPTNESSNPESSADATNTAKPVPPRQPTVPVRRGKGKGFGSKDLATMRARSMTSMNSTSQAGGSNDSKAEDK